MLLNARWTFENGDAVHMASGSGSSPDYFEPEPENINLEAGVTYCIEMEVISTDGTAGFSTQGGVPSSARRTTPGTISEEFVSDGNIIRPFALENINCVVTGIKIIPISLYINSKYILLFLDKIQLFVCEGHVILL